MPDVIDELIITLGLDPTKYRAEAAKAREDLKKTGKAADDAANQVDRNQRKIDEADSKRAKAMDARAKQTEYVFQRLTGTALGFFSAFEISKGIVGFTQQLTAADAAVGRLSTNLGISPQKLGGLQNALTKIGGSAGDAQSAMSLLVNDAQGAMLGQMPQGAQFLSMAGVSLADLQNPQQALDKLSDFFKRVGPQKATFFGSQIGLPQSMINLMENGSGAFNKALAAGEGEAPNRADTDAAQSLQTELNTVDQKFTEVGRKLKTEVTPYLLEFLKALEKIADWALQHPIAAGAAGLGMSVAGGAASAAALRQLARFILGRGGAGAAGLAAEAETAAGAAAGGGAIALSAPLLAAAAAAGIAFYPSGLDQGEGQGLDSRFPNRPRGDSATVDRTLPQPAQTLLNSIGGGESKNQYNALYGGGAFQGYDKFPDWDGKMGPDGISHAAGRYQFEPATWARASAALGLTDFSPASQDKAAWWLAQQDYRTRTGRDLLTDLQAHDSATDALIRKNLGPTWTSLNARSNSNFAVSLGDGGALGMGTESRGVPSRHALPGLSLPEAHDAYLNDLRSGASPEAHHGGTTQNTTSSTTNHNSTSVGEVHVHTAATDADGISRDIGSSLMRYSWVAQNNGGLA